MSKTKKEIFWNGGLEILQAELEKRYGAAVAQGIIDQIKRTEKETSTPDYMVVKACSEMTELFREDAQKLLAKIKDYKAHRPVQSGNLTDLDAKRLEMEFRRVFRLYWVSMKLFYSLYRAALLGYRAKIASPFSLPSETGAIAFAA